MFYYGPCLILYYCRLRTCILYPLQQVFTNLKLIRMFLMLYIFSIFSEMSISDGINIIYTFCIISFCLFALSIAQRCAKLFKSMAS